MSDWQGTCAQCKHLIRSGDEGIVWHCRAVRAGKNYVYAVTARKRSRGGGKCGPDARLFSPADRANGGGNG